MSSTATTYAQGAALLHFARNGIYGPGGAELTVLGPRRGRVCVRHRRPPLPRRSLEPVLLPARLLLRRGVRGASPPGSCSSSPSTPCGGTAHPAALKLADEIAARAPEGIDRVFFTSGGSESVESAIKIARQYHVFNGQPERTKWIARNFAYHGVTLGALALTGVPGYKQPFGRPALDVHHVSNTNAFRSALQGEDLTAALLQELEDAILAEGPETVAVIVAEPVQNAGGCLTPPPGYWQGLRRIADKYGILLHADEVITGFGRLGEWFGVQRYDVVPDLITVAKGITSAYAPMGAVLVAEKVAAPFYEDSNTLLHGVTFGGHPLSAAIALKNIEIFERDGVLENVRKHEPYLKSRLESLLELPIAGDLRGAGYFWAIELVKDAENTRLDADERERVLRGAIPRAMHEAGLIARADDRLDAVFQISPPLISDVDVIDEIVEKMHTVLLAAQQELGLH